jgi:hypothetical protein
MREYNDGKRRKSWRTVDGKEKADNKVRKRKRKNYKRIWVFGMSCPYSGLFIRRKFSDYDYSECWWGVGGSQNVVIWGSRYFNSHTGDQLAFSTARWGKCQRASNSATIACLHILSTLLLTVCRIIWRDVMCPSTIVGKWTENKVRRTADCKVHLASTFVIGDEYKLSLVTLKTHVERAFRCYYVLVTVAVNASIFNSFLCTWQLVFVISFSFTSTQNENKRSKSSLSIIRAAALWYWIHLHDSIHQVLYLPSLLLSEGFH